MHPLRKIVEPKLLKIVRLFLHHQDKLYHLSEIAEQTGLPISTTHRLMQKVIDMAGGLRGGAAPGFDAATGPVTQPCCRRRVVEDGAEPFGQLSAVARRDEEAGLVVFDDVAGAGDLAGHTGEPGGHRLEERHRQPLPE